MNPAMLPPAQTAPPPIEVDLLSLLVADPFVVVMLIVLVLLMPFIWYAQRSQGRFMSKQEGYLDHQRDANERALSQSETMNKALEARFARMDAQHADALAKAEAAVELQRRVVGELEGLNRTLAAIASRVEALPQQGKAK